MGVKRGLKGVLFKSAGRRTLSLKFRIYNFNAGTEQFFFRRPCVSAKVFIVSNQEGSDNLLILQY